MITKAYSLSSYLFIALLLLTFTGFYVTYFGQFPGFPYAVITHHFHALTFVSWFALLITQPFLIHYKQLEWHRRLGKVSYVLMPLVLVSIYMVCRTQFERGVEQHLPLNQNLAAMYMSMQGLFQFGLFYLLAILNRGQIANHTRYIIVSSLVLMGPSLGRILIIWLGMPLQEAIWYGGLLSVDIALLLLLAVDKLSHKPTHAYAVALGISFTCHLAWYFNFQETVIWQAIAGVLF